MSRSNIFEAGAAEIPELFGDYLEAPTQESGQEGGCVILALSRAPLAKEARRAIENSAAALGFGENACTYATLLPSNPNVEGGDIALDAQSLFLIVEGLDPLRIVAADEQSIALLAQAYRCSYPRDAAARVFGRPSALFVNLEALLATPEGKQKAWSLFKTFN